jgi:hypothetical protein
MKKLTNRELELRAFRALDITRRDIAPDEAIFTTEVLQARRRVIDAIQAQLRPSIKDVKILESASHLKNPVRDPSHKKLLRGLSKHFAMDEAALRRMKKNPSRGEFDQHAATELVIYADNTRELVPQKEAIARNLLRKIRAGTYDSTRAVVAWRHWIDAAAKRYAKEFGTGNMAEIFSVPTREWAAREIAHRNQLMLNAGEWDWILAKKNPGRKHHSAKWRRCVRKVKKRGGAASPYAVCTKAVKNPRGFVIVARRRGETLYFDGKKHFSDRHRPHVFSTHEAALKRGRELVRAYGDALARYRITVEPAPGK